MKFNKSSWNGKTPIQRNHQTQIYQQHKYKQNNLEQQLKMNKTTTIVKETKETYIPKKAEEKIDKHPWILQCGSFKGSDQAEKMRAQIAFKGFDLRITTSNGWNRAITGPVKGKNNADNTISYLRIIGHTNCIRLVSGVEPS